MDSFLRLSVPFVVVALLDKTIAPYQQMAKLRRTT